MTKLAWENGGRINRADRRFAFPPDLPGVNAAGVRDPIARTIADNLDAALPDSARMV